MNTIIGVAQSVQNDWATPNLLNQSAQPSSAARLWLSKCFSSHYSMSSVSLLCDKDESILSLGGPDEYVLGRGPLVKVRIRIMDYILNIIITSHYCRSLTNVYLEIMHYCVCKKTEQ